MKNEFELLFVSETKYESLAAEILYRGQRLCQINKERGNDSMEIEFLVDLYKLNKIVEMKFSLDDFEEMLRRARRELEPCG